MLFLQVHMCLPIKWTSLVFLSQPGEYPVEVVWADLPTRATRAPALHLGVESQLTSRSNRNVGNVDVDYVDSTNTINGDMMIENKDVLLAEIYDMSIDMWVCLRMAGTAKLLGIERMNMMFFSIKFGGYPIFRQSKCSGTRVNGYVITTRQKYLCLLTSLLCGSGPPASPMLAE